MVEYLSVTATIIVIDFRSLQSYFRNLASIRFNEDFIKILLLNANY